MISVFIKIYIHPDKLAHLNRGDSVLAKQMTMSQYDIEIYIDSKKYHVVNQSNGILVSKKSLFDRIFRKG